MILDHGKDALRVNSSSQVGRSKPGVVHSARHGQSAQPEPVTAPCVQA